MKIFLSHASRDKPLIREIRADLPDHVRSWIDESELLVGENLKSSLRTAIQFETDFLVVFIGAEAVRSDWVRRELGWALDKERQIGRVFVLPVVLDLDAWRELPEEITDRRYLLCTDFTRVAVRQFARRFSDELFAWVSRLAEKKAAIPASTQQGFVEAAKRRAHTLARAIVDDPSAAIESGEGTARGLDTLINALAPMQRMELLFIYEVTRGRFKTEVDPSKLSHGARVQIVFNASGFGRITHELGWTGDAFHELRYEYGLGDETYYVREVFLDAIHALTDEERKATFLEIEIVSVRMG